jgi:Cu-Zn family superoxide dismutase
MVERMLSLALAMVILAAGAGGALAADTRYVLPGDNLFPEGIATQASTGDFFVGSTTDGTVLRGNAGSPRVEVFLPGGGDGRTDVRGLKVDGRGRLYLAGGATGQVFVYDIATRRLLARFATGLTPSFVNDATIAPNGDAYFTDSQSPAIYRVAADLTGPSAFEHWIDLTGSPIAYTQGFNLNGIVASADGRSLVTVQSNTGKLFRIEIATKRVTEIALGGATLLGGDGMLLDRQTLQVMRNAAEALVTLRLAPDFASATVVATTTDPEFDFPTTFARAGDRLLVLNSQLDKRTANQPPALPFVVVAIPVPGAMPGMPSTGAGGGQAQIPLAPALLSIAGGLALLGGAGQAMRRRRGHA